MYFVRLDERRVDLQVINFCVTLVGLRKHFKRTFVSETTVGKRMEDETRTPNLHKRNRLTLRSRPKGVFENLSLETTDRTEKDPNIECE